LLTAAAGPISNRPQVDNLPHTSAKRMNRSFWLLVVAFCACRKSAPPLNLFPQTIAGGWRRTGLAHPSLSDAPDPVPRTAVNRFETATYEGPGKLEARVYELDSPGVALDLVQRWRPSADTVFFYRDRYFVVVKWQEADRKALEAFVRELEARLGKPTEPS
jgi:hypothetical protein